MKTLALLVTLWFPAICLAEYSTFAVAPVSQEYQTFAVAPVEVRPAPKPQPKPAPKPIIHGPHWKHPDTIYRHLIQGHGYSPSQLAGLSNEQMLSLHDAAHGGLTGTVVRNTKK